MFEFFFILFLLSPLGFIVGIIKPPDKLTRKKILAIFGGVTLVLFILMLVTVPKTQVDKQEPTKPSVTQKNVQKPQEEMEQQVKTIPFEVVDSWKIPAGGEGKRIVISSEYVNEKDMRLIGEQLKSETADNENSIIMVYTDKRAAEMVGGSSFDFSDEESDFIEKNYVGQYIRNVGAKHHAFSIYLNGTGDVSSYIEIDY